MSKTFFSNFIDGLISEHGILAFILASQLLAVSILALLTLTFGMGAAGLLYFFTLAFTIIFLATMHKSPWLVVQFSLPIPRWKIESSVLAIAVFPALSTILLFLIASPFAPEPLSLKTLILVQAAIAGVPALIFIMLRRGFCIWFRLHGSASYLGPAFWLLLVAVAWIAWVYGYMLGRDTPKLLPVILLSLYVAFINRDWYGRKRYHSPKSVLLKYAARHHSTFQTHELLNTTIFWSVFIGYVAMAGGGGLGLTCLAVYILFNQVAAYLNETPKILRVQATLPVPVHRLPINVLWPILSSVVLLAPLCAWIFQKDGNIPAPWTLAVFAILVALTLGGAYATILGRAVDFVVVVVLGVFISVPVIIVPIACCVDANMGLEVQKGLTELQNIAIAIIVVAIVSIPIQMRIISRVLKKQRIGDFPTSSLCERWYEIRPSQ